MRVRIEQSSQALNKVVGEGSSPPDLSLSRLSFHSRHPDTPAQVWNEQTNKQKSLPRNKELTLLFVAITVVNQS